MIGSLSGVATAIFALAAINSVVAFPATRREDALPVLTEQAVSTFIDFSHIASVAYCGPDLTASWTCGDNCDALPGFHVTGSGGDGNAIQYWFTAYSEETKNVVVAHQGTDPVELLSVLTDLKLFLGKPNATLYPGLSEDAMMHQGFLSAQESTADVIYESVMETMTKYNTTSVTFVGHSLGAALSLLDALSLRLRLPEGTKIRVVNYGMPRVGNQAFADEVDRLIPDLTRITNQKDPIPIVPGRRMGYVHPHGEVHIDSDHNWIECPGQDSEDERCTVANVSLMPFGWNIVDHIGWYDEIAIQCWNIGIKARDLLTSTSSST